MATSVWQSESPGARLGYIAFGEQGDESPGGVEENAMQHKFGEEYEAYCRTVGRWLGRRPDPGRTARAAR